MEYNFIEIERKWQQWWAEHKTYKAEPFPEFIKQMIADGGLMASLKKSQK